jgi:hypothetical protein
MVRFGREVVPISEASPPTGSPSFHWAAAQAANSRNAESAAQPASGSASVAAGLPPCNQRQELERFFEREQVELGGRRLGDN